MKKIKILGEEIGSVVAQLLEERSPVTVNAIWENLPFNARANIWGDEIYFAIPVRIGEEHAQETVEVGDLGYWPPGKGFCIFFGPTPISQANEIKPADPVNVFGKVQGDAKIFKKVKQGDHLQVMRSE